MDVSNKYECFRCEISISKLKNIYNKEPFWGPGSYILPFHRMRQRMNVENISIF